MREILGELREWIDAGEEIALATVVETWGSSPRPLGSKMAVTRSGKMAGSVSNGCIEGAVFEEAHKVLKAGRGRIAATAAMNCIHRRVGWPSAPAAPQRSLAGHRPAPRRWAGLAQVAT